MKLVAMMLLCVCTLLHSHLIWATNNTEQAHTRFAPDTELSNTIYVPMLGIDRPKNILVILSWSPLIPWSQNVQKGLLSAIDAQDESIKLYVESMYESPTDFTSARYNFDLGLRAKYENVEFDGIIADSRAAFDYLQALPKDDPDFGQIPTYFIYFAKDLVLNSPYQKTIIPTQQQSIFKTLEMMYATNPAIQTLHVVSNDAYMYQAYVEMVQFYTQKYHPDVTYKFYNHKALSSYKADLSQIPPNDVIIYLPTFIANEDENLNAQQVLAQLSPHASVPIYSFWHNFVGVGAVGGNLMNPHLYGVDAIRSILAFHSLGYFPETSDLGEWVFDYEQLAEFNLTIPNNASSPRIINIPSSIWEDYPTETAVIVVVCVLLMLLIFVYKQQRLGSALKQSLIAEKKAETNALRVDALSKTKSKFMATMSHEIRTPINGIFGALSLLNKQSPTDSQQQYLDMAQYCTENLLDTVNDVLDFSKLDSGQFEISVKPFSPATLLNDVFQYAQLISKDTDLAVMLDTKTLIDVPLLGDKLRLQQVLNNLLNNAIKFTPSGSVTIQADISLSPISNSHYQLNIAIIDTGIGISDKDKRKLFSPFIQINDTLERTKEGSGLGLSICKEIITLMNGSIGVESTVGQGSRFYFDVTLPLSEAPIETDRPRLALNDTETAHSHLNILLVEDNTINQAVMQSQLEYLGHHVTIAEHGERALEILTELPSHFDVALMDIQMPVLNGYDTTVAIRGGQVGRQYQDLPVLALTAHASLNEHEDINLAVFNHYLIKPVQESQLQAALNASIPAR